MKYKDSNDLSRRARLTRIWVAWISLVGLLTLNISVANAVTLTTASVALSNPIPSTASVNYTVTASSVTNGTIKCIQATFSTSPTTLTTPTGFTAASATITAATSTYVNDSGTGWSVTDTANTIQYTNASGITPSTLTGATFIMAGITNSSVADTAYYLSFSTYNNTNCSSSPVDSVVVTYINTNGSNLSLTVNPTMSFTVNGVASGGTCNSGASTSTGTSTSTTIPFGSVTTASNGLVCQSLSIATNAANGYTVYVRYTGKPTSGSNTIADWTGTNNSPTAFSAAGTEAYGYTTSDFALNVANGAVNRFQSDLWAAMTTTNAEVSYSSTGLTTKTVSIGHQVGISGTTKPGTYTTTIIYTCTPVY
ncbi:MAG: hypothetical protein ACHQUB_01810 [Candidatus Saccharimonadia bacterium]